MNGGEAWGAGWGGPGVGGRELQSERGPDGLLQSARWAGRCSVAGSEPAGWPQARRQERTSRGLSEPAGDAAGPRGEAHLAVDQLRRILVRNLGGGGRQPALARQVRLLCRAVVVKVNLRAGAGIAAGRRQVSTQVLQQGRGSPGALSKAGSAPACHRRGPLADPLADQARPPDKHAPSSSSQARAAGATGACRAQPGGAPTGCASACPHMPSAGGACRALPRAVRARKSAVAGAAAAPPPHPGDDVSQLGGVVKHDNVVIQRQVDVRQAAVVGWRLLKGQLAWRAGGQSGKGGARVNNVDHEGKTGWRPTARSPAAPRTAACLRRTQRPTKNRTGSPSSALMAGSGAHQSTRSARCRSRCTRPSRR